MHNAKDFGKISEKVYVLNENGTVDGLKDRQYVHENGILHSTVQCWIMNEYGELLLQRRAPTKDKSAGKWDVSFGGHCVEVSDTDILINNVIKEGKEELGLNICAQDLIKLGEARYISQENKNREIVGVFLLKIGSNQKFNFTDSEVSEVKWIKPDNLRDNIIKNPGEYANRLAALTILLEYLKDA